MYLRIFRLLNLNLLSKLTFLLLTAVKKAVKLGFDSKIDFIIIFKNAYVINRSLSLNLMLKLDFYQRMLVFNCFYQLLTKNRNSMSFKLLSITKNCVEAK